MKRMTLCLALTMVVAGCGGRIAPDVRGSRRGIPVRTGNALSDRLSNRVSNRLSNRWAYPDSGIAGHRVGGRAGSAGRSWARGCEMAAGCG